MCQLEGEALNPWILVPPTAGLAPAGGSGQVANVVELVVVTRRDCGLCEEMESVAACFVSSGEATLELLDVDSDPELVRRYGAEVPVLLVNGRRAFKYRVETGDLRRRIRAEQRRATIRRWRAFLSGRSAG